MASKNLNLPICLIILDGWGVAPASPGNAITQAQTPNLIRILNSYPHTLLEASQEAVGLPHNEPGNSEAGHLNLGAGSIVPESLTKINTSIADGSFFKSKALLHVANHVKQYNSNCHFLGLIGSGGVHSNIEHLFALLNWAKNNRLNKVFLHLFTDGRDSSPTSSIQHLKSIEAKIKADKVGQIATIIGRFYSMDRDNRWDRTKIAYQALTEGKGLLTDSYAKAIETSYQNNKTDEFIEPIILKDKNIPLSIMADNDAVIFFNFRIDRPRQLTKAFVLPDFEDLVEKGSFDPYAERYGKKQYQDRGKKMLTFKRSKVLKNLLFVTMTEYEPGLPVLTIFPPNQVDLPLGRIIAENGWRQLRAAETEKERHVTYYFSGKRDSLFPGEDHLIIPSPNISTYDLKPEMSAMELTQEVIKRINLKIYDFILLNYANPDMVGHTGVLSAGIKACEVVDNCLQKIVDHITLLGGTCIITADHGNVEEMVNLATGEVDTKHSTFPVPLAIVNNQFKGNNLFLNKGILADVAPTILKISQITKPSSMTEKSLI